MLLTVQSYLVLFSIMFFLLVTLSLPLLFFCRNPYSHATTLASSQSISLLQSILCLANPLSSFPIRSSAAPNGPVRTSSFVNLTLLLCSFSESQTIACFVAFTRYLVHHSLSLVPKRLLTPCLYIFYFSSGLERRPKSTFHCYPLELLRQSPYVWYAENAFIITILTPFLSFHELKN